MSPRICLVPRLNGTGGMASFQNKLAMGLGLRGMEVSFSLEDKPYDAVLVIGGTRHLAQLWRARRQGTPIIQRLDGINWIQRARRTSMRYRLRAESGNLLLALIRARFADRVVYQSEFVRDWWEKWYGKTRVPFHIIHNGVALDVYNPKGSGSRPDDRYRMMVVEGSLIEGMSVGLEWAVGLAERLNRVHHLPVEISIAARVTQQLKTYWQENSRIPIDFLGIVPRERIPELDRSAHFFFSAELNPACPNAVIEALACGLPVASFDTGAIPELVTAEAGKVVPYGGNPWKVEPPDIPSLASAVETMLKDLPHYQAGARARAEQAFGLDMMVNKYLDALLG